MPEKELGNFKSACIRAKRPRPSSMPHAGLEGFHVAVSGSFASHLGAVPPRCHMRTCVCAIALSLLKHFCILTHWWHCHCILTAGESRILEGQVPVSLKPCILCGFADPLCTGCCATERKNYLCTRKTKYRSKAHSPHVVKRMLKLKILILYLSQV